MRMPAPTGRRRRPSSHPRRPKSEPASPRAQGAGGFEFGDTSDSAAKKCTDAGFEYSSRGSDYFACSGVPQSFGYAAKTLVWFRNDQLSWIRFTIVLDGKGPAQWTAAYNDLASALSSKYGAPTSDARQLPDECNGEALTECMADGRVAFSTKWSPEKGPSMELSMGKPKDGKHPAIRLLYDNTGHSAQDSSRAL